MGSHGLKVSLPGKDISSEIPEDFSFNSENEFHPKIILQAGDTKVISAGSYADITIPHGESYMPMVVPFIQSDPATNIWRMGCHFNNGVDAYISNDGLYTYVDDTNFKMRIHNGFGVQKTIAYYYFIFGDNAS